MGTTNPLPSLRLELERSADHPISITLVLGGGQPNCWDEVHPILRQLLSRSKSVHLSLDMTPAIGDLLGASAPPIMFPNLRRLRAFNAGETLKIDLSNAPFLEDLQISGDIVVTTLSSVHLTRVCVNVFPRWELDFGHLSRCPNLKILSFGEENHPSSSLASITFPTLQQLRYSSYEDYVGPVLETFLAPDLRHIEMVPWDRNPFSAQFPALESLALMREITLDKLTDGLLGIPTLRQLSLICRPFEPLPGYRELLESLSERDVLGVFKLVPRLRMLRLQVQDLGNPPIHLAEEFLAARNEGMTELVDMPFVLVLGTHDSREAEVRWWAEFVSSHPDSAGFDEVDEAATNPFRFENW